MIDIVAMDGMNINEYGKNLETVASQVPWAALFEQLAEESAELAQAALKMARVVRGENPTPVTKYDAMVGILEELSDVALVCEALDLEADRQGMKKKLQRWVKRLQQKGGEDV